MTDVTELIENWTLTETFDTPDGVVRWASAGDGPAIVLVHGSPYSSRIWRDIVPALARTHTVYVWDLLGYGQSEQRDGQDVSIAAQGRILASLLRHWQLDAPRVVGNDFGGGIALRALLLEGARYSDLTLVDALGGGAWAGGLFKLIHDHADTFAQLPGYAHRALIGSHIARGTHTGYRPGELEKHIEPWTGETGQAAFYRQWAQAETSDTDGVEARLGEVDVPTTIVWGRQDQILGPQFAEVLHAGIPGSELHWVEQAGHLLQHDAPGELLAILGRGRE